jgi:hypothetical protein
MYEYFSTDIIRMINSIRMRWAEHIAHMGEKNIVCKVSVLRPE